MGMALLLDVITPSGLATYHVIGVHAYHTPDFDGDPSWAFVILMSYADKAAADDPAVAPWLQTRFDLPYIDTEPYGFIQTWPGWTDAVNDGGV